MSGQEPFVRDRTDALDALGNTTAATGKGFAIGSAALTALALLAAYMEEVRVGVDRMGDSYTAKNQIAIERQLEKEATAAPVVQKPVVTQADLADPAALTKKIEAIMASASAKDAGGPTFVVEGKRTFRYLGDGYFTHFAEDTSEDDIEIKGTTYLDKDGAVRDSLGESLKKGGELGDANLAPFIDNGQLVRIKDASMEDFMSFYEITLMNPKVLCGMFLGAMLTFVFCAMTMQAVGRAAGAMVEEVRRQFREIAGIMEGEATPDYASCVEISTKGAQKEMIVPSLMALIAPVLLGCILGVAGVMGLLAGGLTCGFALAIMMANAGGAWDNAKKYIENEDKTYADGDTEQANPLTGKGSERHKAGVVGDTVGDPFKDTSGPSLNILIKLMSMVSVVFAGFVVKMAPIIGGWLGLN